MVENSNEGSGVNFIFHIDEHEISAQGGLGDGREKIYLDNKLVSETRSFSRKSAHNLQVDNKEFTITFSVKNPFSNKIECELKTGEKVIQRLRCEVSPKGSVIAIAFLVAMPLFFSFGRIKAYFNFGDNIDYAVYFVFFLTFVITINIAVIKGSKAITDITHE